MTTYKQLLAKHEREVADLRAECPHAKLTDWIDEWWDLHGATGRQIRFCLRCEARIHVKAWCQVNGCKDELIDEAIHKGDGQKTFAGLTYCEKHMKEGDPECMKFAAGFKRDRATKTTISI